jgi:hypothetical protein
MSKVVSYASLHFFVLIFVFSRACVYLTRVNSLHSIYFPYLLPVFTFCNYFLYSLSVFTFCIYFLYLLPVFTFCNYFLYLLSVFTFCIYILYLITVFTFCMYFLYLLSTQSTYLHWHRNRALQNAFQIQSNTCRSKTHTYSHSKNVLDNQLSNVHLTLDYYIHCSLENSKNTTWWWRWIIMPVFYCLCLVRNEWTAAECRKRQTRGRET